MTSPNPAVLDGAPEPPSGAEAARREIEFFDRLVAEEGDFNPFLDRGWETLKRRFREMAKPDAGCDLLDVGCGTGQSRQIYIGAVASYTGIDLSPGAIGVAQQRFPESHWQVADTCKLPFPDGRFDAVAFSSVLHHIPSFPVALKEAFRVLKPGGKVFAFDPNLRHPAMALFRHPKSPLYIAKGVSPDERPLRPSVLAKAFREAGFDTVVQRCQSDLPYRQVAAGWMNSVLKLYNAGDWLMEQSRLGRIFGTFVISTGIKPNITQSCS